MNHPSARFAPGGLAAAYRRDEVLTDSPLRLVIRLYAGTITALERSRRGSEQGDLLVARKELNRARALICELLGALDMERGGEIAQRLRALYDFLLSNLMRPDARPDPRRLQAAEDIVRKIKDGFDVLLANGADRGSLV